MLVSQLVLLSPPVVALRVSRGGVVGPWLAGGLQLVLLSSLPPVRGGVGWWGLAGAPKSPPMVVAPGVAHGGSSWCL